MIETSAELALHLGEDVTTLATCIRVIRRDGTVFAFTSATADLSIDGVVYHAKGGFSPAASVETTQSLSVDSLEIEAILDDEGISEDDLRRGLFDGAGIDVFVVNWKNPSQGKLMLRRGTLGEVTLRRAQFAAEIRGLSQAFATQVGELYQPGCNVRRLGDERCKVALAPFTHTLNLSDVLQPRRQFAHAANLQADHTFSFGTVKFVSGANQGYEAEVKSYAGGVFTCQLPLPFDVAVGDTFEAIRGCDRTFNTCRTVFANQLNFRGFPHLPGVDEMLRTSQTAALLPAEESPYVPPVEPPPTIPTPPPPPSEVVYWSITPVVGDVAEGAAGATTTMRFNVSRTGLGTTAAAVDYAVELGTATADDFAGQMVPSGTMNFAAGEVTKELQIVVQGDAQVEADETFNVVLANPSVGSVRVTSAPAVIRNDDAATPPPPPPPPQEGKTTAAPVLQAKGLSLIWQDKLGRPNAPTDSHQFFSPAGSRNTSTDFNLQDNRLSVGQFDGKPCMIEVFRPNKVVLLNYRTQYFPVRYRKMGLCVDVFYPNSLDLSSIDPSKPDFHGKTAFGLACGHPDYNRPGVPSSRGWTGEVNYVENQFGCACGVNYAHRRNGSHLEFAWYTHIVGAKVSGVNRLRTDLYSIPPAGYPSEPKKRVPKGRWFRLELYGAMDTDRSDGALEMWIDGVLTAKMHNIDLGGWVGDRGIRAGLSQKGTAGSGPLSNDCPAHYKTLGGFGFVGPFIRAMGGGYSMDTQFIPKFGGNAYYHNWRVYAASPI